MDSQTTDGVLDRTHADKLVEFVENLVERTGCLALCHWQILLRQTIHIFLLETRIVHQFDETLTLTLDSLVEDTACLSGISKVLVTTQIELFKLTVDSRTGIIIDGKVLAFCQMQEDLRQLIGRVIVEMNGLGKAALQTRVRINKVMHLVGITRHDTNELSTVIFQTFQQCVNSLSTKGVAIARLQGISLIDKENTTKCLVYQLVCLDSSLTCITSHELSTVCLHQLTTSHNAQGLKDVSHDTCHRGLTSSRVTSEHIVLALEGLSFSTTNLQIKECRQVRNLLLNRSKTNQTIEFLKTIFGIDRLWSLIRNILLVDGHQFLIAHRRDIHTLQTLSLFLADLIEERTHRTTIGEVFVTRVVHLRDHLLSQFFSLRREDILLRLGEYLHNLKQLLWRVVLDIEEIIETAAETWINTEEVFHKLSAVVFHTLHQFLQCLGTLIITIARSTQRSQCIGLINEEDSAFCLVAETIHHLWGLALIRANHLGTINLNHMTAVEITYRSKDLS